MSRVSRKVAEAVTHLFSSGHTLDLYTSVNFPHHAALDSALLKSWAARISNLRLHYSCLTRPGLPANLAAAGPLEKLGVHCNDVLQTGQIEHLFASCWQVQRLEVGGCHILSSFPPAVQSPSVCLGGQSGQTFHCMLPSALLYKVVDLTHLEELELHIQDRKVLLDCPFLLPQLKKLSLKLELHEDTLSSLSWLSRQPCACLCLSVDVCTPALAAHQALTEQLQQLHIGQLELRMNVALCLAVQTSWTRVRASSSCSLNFGLEEGHFGLLQALPCCPCVTINSPFHAEASVTWEALTSQAARFLIRLGFDKRLSILGGWHVPCMLEGLPWQVVFHSLKARPGPRWACKSRVKVLQNSAAICCGSKRGRCISRLFPGYIYYIPPPPDRSATTRSRALSAFWIRPISNLIGLVTINCGQLCPGAHLRVGMGAHPHPKIFDDPGFEPVTSRTRAWRHTALKPLVWIQKGTLYFPD